MVEFSIQRQNGTGPPYHSVTNKSTHIIIECYLPAERLELPFLPESGLYVLALPRPRGWPVRPEGGFTDNTQGFENSDDADYNA